MIFQFTSYPSKISDVGRSNKNSDGKIVKNCLKHYGVRRRHQILILKKDLESQNHCAFAISSAEFGRPFYPQETKNKKIHGRK